MPVPASVIEILETNKIAYQLKASQTRLAGAQKTLAEPTRAACLVKSLVLQDTQGKLQLLLPSDSLIDLSAIKSQFGRNLENLSLSDMDLLLTQQNVKSVPAIPEWQGLTTLVDASLLKHETLWLETGDNEQLLELKQSDFQSIIRSANIGELSVKAPSVPTTAETDREQIVHALKNFTSLRIKQRLEDTLELPPLPETAQRIIKLRSDPDADISDLSNIVELDPSLAAQVVSWAASPYYSAPGKIKSVHDAIVRVLGFDMVLNLALGLALGKSLDTSIIGQKNLQAYWQNAVCVAATVEGLVTSIAREHRPGFGLSYLSGLLHNFGQFTLAEIFPPYYANVMRHTEVNPHIPRASIEQHLIGVSSCQITAWLFEMWNMPEEVVTAIRQQNNPDYEGDDNRYPKLIFVAKQLLANHGFNGGTYQAIPEQLMEELHLDTETANITVENILESLDDLNSIAEKIQG